jgi:hypothetical protein
MSYPRIFSKVYREPWCMKPSAHHAIQASLTNALKGRSRSVLEEEEEEKMQQVIALRAGFWVG